MKEFLNEEWSYNEWPDVDIDGNVIEKKVLTEGCRKKVKEACKDCKEELTSAEAEELAKLEAEPVVKAKDRYRYQELNSMKDDDTRKVCDDKVCKEELCEAADEEEVEEPAEEEVEEEAVETLKDCLVAALEEIEVPEDEELDPKVVLDAIVGCLSDEDKEYLCSILCPEEEIAEEPAEEEVEEADIELAEKKTKNELVEATSQFNVDLDLSDFVSDDIKKIIADGKICRLDLQDKIDDQNQRAKKTGRCPICGGELANLNCTHCGNSFRQEGTFGFSDLPVVDQELLDSIVKVYPGFNSLSVDDKVDYIFTTYVLNNKSGLEYFDRLSKADPKDPKYTNARREAQTIKNDIKQQLSNAYKYSKYQKVVNKDLINN